MPCLFVLACTLHNLFIHCHTRRTRMPKAIKSTAKNKALHHFLIYGVVAHAVDKVLHALKLAVRFPLFFHIFDDLRANVFKSAKSKSNSAVFHLKICSALVDIRWKNLYTFASCKVDEFCQFVGACYSVI